MPLELLAFVISRVRVRPKLSLNEGCSMVLDFSPIDATFFQGSIQHHYNS